MKSKYKIVGILSKWLLLRNRLWNDLIKINNIYKNISKKE